MRRQRMFSAVDFATMTDLNHYDDRFGVLGGVQEAAAPLAHAVELVAGEFFGARGPGVGRKPLNLGDNAPAVPLRQFLDFLDG